MNDNNNRLVIEFSDSAQRSAFRDAYSGDFCSYHPNYSGGFDDDMILGSGTPLLNMERDKINNFQRLAQDVSLFNGRIRVED